MFLKIPLLQLKRFMRKRFNSDEGGLLLNDDKAERLHQYPLENGKMTTDLLAQDIDLIIDKVGLGKTNENTKFLILPTNKLVKRSSLRRKNVAIFNLV